MKTLMTLLLFSCFTQGFCSYTIKEGKIVNTEVVPTQPPSVHYGMGMAAIEKRDMYEAITQLSPIVFSCQDEPFYEDACYWLGLAYYHIDEFEFANECFDKCISAPGEPKYLEDALEYKFYIAEKFRCGAKRHFFGTKHLPMWAPAYDRALIIYEEIITALPCHDLACESLYSKGALLWSQKDFPGAIASFESLIKRFPKHELAPESYRNITRIYLQQSKFEYQNPDLIALAEINKKKFERDFPGDELLEQTEKDFCSLKETYADGFYETGKFYERIGKKNAALIYYKKAIQQYPDTEVSLKCQERLTKIQ